MPPGCVSNTYIEREQMPILPVNQHLLVVALVE
jgi:hypothetical protein